MSEFINNRAYRKNVLKDIIKQLHDGKTVEEVKAQFEEVFGNVSATEITEAEQALINEGVPVEEIQSLCDVHASVFKGSIEDIHAVVEERDIPGHPLNIMVRENRAIENLISDEILPLLSRLTTSNLSVLERFLRMLATIDLHYSRKENLLFPYMEKYGITAPPKVMWGVDDEIRADIKVLLADIKKPDLDLAFFVHQVETAVDRVNEMIFKEENILFPMLLETLTQEEWKHIENESSEIGYMINDVPRWTPVIVEEEQKANILEELHQPGVVTLPTGVLQVEELCQMLNALPFDITFVDKDDTVKYFSQGKERIFTRTKAIIGRKVANCHPPGSVHVVENIVNDFKSGKKDHEDFWIPMKDMFVFIRYFAVRSETGEYLGTLEVTQNIKPIQALTGQKRLVED